MLSVREVDAVHNIPRQGRFKPECALGSHRSRRGACSARCKHAQVHPAACIPLFLFKWTGWPCFGNDSSFWWQVFVVAPIADLRTFLPGLEHLWGSWTSWETPGAAGISGACWINQPLSVKLPVGGLLGGKCQEPCSSYSVMSSLWGPTGKIPLWFWYQEQRASLVAFVLWALEPHTWPCDPLHTSSQKAQMTSCLFVPYTRSWILLLFPTLTFPLLPLFSFT